MRHLLATFSVVVSLLVMAGCGGGGEVVGPDSTDSTNQDPTGSNPPTTNPPVTDPPVVDPPGTKSCIDQEKAVIRPGARAGYLSENLAEGDGSVGGSDGEGDGNGALGQFYNTRVEVRDRNLTLVGSTVTDSKGSISIDLNGCAEPIEVTYIGGQGAEYFDEATGRRTPFPAGAKMRLRLSKLAGSFSVTPYTEAAVRLMQQLDTQALSETGLKAASSNIGMKAVTIADANQVISSILTDQIPGFLRRDRNRNIAQIPVGGVVIPIGEENVSTPDSLTDTTAGRRGAVVAGHIEGAGALLADPDGAALKAGEHLAADLSDGRLDLQGPGGPVLAQGEAPSYTYESLWRSQSIGAGLTLLKAGAASLRQETTSTAITEISSSSRIFYELPGAGGTPLFVAGTFGGQRVRLYADGRLTIARAMGGDAFLQGRNEFPQSSNVANPTEVDVTGGPFVDVKVGSRGEVLALTQNRDAIVYIEALQLFQATAGDSQRSEADVEAQMDALVARREQTRFDILSLHGTQRRVVSFTPSPEQRSYRPGVAPQFLYVLNDGKLWGANSRSPAQSQEIPSPAQGLLSVVYDKFVPPGLDAAYGPAPTAPITLPFNGPRRLFGLTRSGKVRVWFEGEVAEGRELAIPGVVVQLVNESKTHIYALTSEGRIYWINADQAINAGATQVVTPQPSLDAYDRRFALNHVEPVAITEKVCWIARAEAAICNSGRAFRWDEAIVRFESPSGNAIIPDRAVFPGAIGTPVALDGVTGLWRMTGVEEFFAVLNGRSFVSQGMRYLMTDGRITSPQELLGLRNLTVPPCNGCAKSIDANQFVTAINSVFKDNGPLRQGVSIPSTYSTDGVNHVMTVTVQPVAARTYDYSLRFDDGTDPTRPNVTLRIRLLDGPGFSQPAGITVVDVISGDSYRVASNPSQVVQSDSLLPIDMTWLYRDGDYSNPVRSEGGPNRQELRVIPQATQDEFGMRICFAYTGQVGATRTGHGGLLCTVHDNRGNYQGVSSTYSVSRFNAAGSQTSSTLTDFNQYSLPWPQ